MMDEQIKQWMNGEMDGWIDYLQTSGERGMQASVTGMYVIVLVRE